MRWKDWPRWLRYGLIAGIFILIIIIISKLFLRISIVQSLTLIFDILPFIIYDSIFFPIFGEDYPFYLFPIFAFCFYFIAGALLGLIVNKIKPSWDNWTNKGKTIFLSIIITVIHIILTSSADYIFHPTNWATVFFAPLLIISYFITHSLIIFILVIILSEAIVFGLSYLIVYNILKYKNKKPLN